MTIKIIGGQMINNGGDGIRVEGSAEVEISGTSAIGNKGAGFRIDETSKTTLTNPFAAGNHEGGIIVNAMDALKSQYAVLNEVKPALIYEAAEQIAQVPVQERDGTFKATRLYRELAGMKFAEWAQLTVGLAQFGATIIK